jgi:excisionase family DNA binding protein
VIHTTPTGYRSTTVQHETAPSGERHSGAFRNMTDHEHTAPSEWLTINEAAHELRVSRESVKRYIRRGLLRTHRLPHGQARFRRVDVEGLLTIQIQSDGGAA